MAAAFAVYLMHVHPEAAGLVSCAITAPAEKLLQLGCPCTCNDHAAGLSQTICLLPASSSNQWSRDPDVKYNTQQLHLQGDYQRRQHQSILNSLLDGLSDQHYPIAQLNGPARASEVQPPCIPATLRHAASFILIYCQLQPAMSAVPCQLTVEVLDGKLHACTATLPEQYQTMQMPAAQTAACLHGYFMATTCQ